MTEDGGTPAGFLSQLGQKLLASEGVDVELANIIAKHILSADPAKNNLEEAITAISALAMKRAANPKVDANG